MRIAWGITRDRGRSSRRRRPGVGNQPGERGMRTAMRAVMLLLVFRAGALAEDKTQLTASQKEAVSQVKSQAMKERQYLMNECQRIVTQVAGLQESVKSIEGDKAKTL